MRRYLWLLLLLPACLQKQSPASRPEAPRNTEQKSPEIKVGLDFASTGKAAGETRNIIEFTIPKDTGENSWNTESDGLVLFEGQILRIRNDDSIPHTLHTPGRPCEHGTSIDPGKTFDCILTSLYDARVDGPLYDHAFPDAKFWFTVLPRPDKVLASSCLSCHSQSRHAGGLNLESWPPVSGSTQLAEQFIKRLAPGASDTVRMPPAGDVLAPTDAESLTAWARAGFFELPTAFAVKNANRTMRWTLTQNGEVRQTEALTGMEKSLTFRADTGSFKLLFEEKIQNEWMFLAEFEVTLDRDQSLTIPAKPVTKRMKDGYYGIDDLYAYAASNQLQSVAELLAVLPNEFHNNFVLMKDSKSRHLSSTQYPRGILFSQGARVVLGFSSHPSDPLRETLEMAEALDNGTWKFREITFRERRPELSQDDRVCKSCHTENPRPIWGSYPNWPGAFGDEGGHVTAEEYTVLKQLGSNPETRDRFASVNFKFRDDVQSFYLTVRSYDYANTVFNAELGRTASHVMAQRIKQQPQYKQRYADWLLRDECSGTGGSYGVITAADMDLSVGSNELAHAQYYWDDSSNIINALVGFWALMDLKQDNAVLTDIFAPVAAEMNAYAQLRNAAGLELSLDGPLGDFRPSQYAYRRVLGDMSGQKEDTYAGPSLTTRRQEFCAELEKIAHP